MREPSPPVAQDVDSSAHFAFRFRRRLPSSRVISAPSCSNLRSMMSAALYRMFPRAGAGIADHAGYAAAAAAAASATSCAVPFESEPTISSVFAGFAVLERLAASGPLAIDVVLKCLYAH